MTKEIPNNYRENPIKYYMAELSELDAETIAARCCLEHNDDYVYITILGTPYRIEIPSFSFEKLDPEKPDYLSSQAAQVLILHFLTESRFVPSSGKFISYREYPSGDLYFKAFEGRCLKRLAYSFGTNIRTFKEKCEAVGAKEIRGGDAAYEFEFMPGLNVQIILWGPDEEFPPSAQMLFSDNFPFSFSAEGVAGLGDILISAVKKAG